MLLVIDETLSASLSMPLSPVEASALENLASAWQAGKHAITGDRGALRHLNAIPTLSERSRQAFLAIEAKVSQFGKLRHSVGVVVRVVGGTGAIEVVRDHTGDKEIQVPLVYFEDLTLCTETVLLAENLIDAQVYVGVGIAYAATKGMNVPVVADTRGGGGHTTALEFKKIQDTQSRFCIGIADSDRKYCNGPLGDTASELLAANRPDRPLTDARVYEVRMIENLVPPEYYRLKVSKEQAEILGDLTSVADASRSEQTSNYLYLNVRKGEKLYPYRNTGGDPKYREFMTAVTKAMSTDGNGQLECSVDSPCGKKSDCLCYLYRGLGRNFTADALNAVAASPVDSYVLLSSEQKEVWDTIGRDVLSWCCGGARLTAF